MYMYIPDSVYDIVTAYFNENMVYGSKHAHYLWNLNPGPLIPYNSPKLLCPDMLNGTHPD